MEHSYCIPPDQGKASIQAANHDHGYSSNTSRETLLYSPLCYNNLSTQSTPSSDQKKRTGSQQ